MSSTKLNIKKLKDALDIIVPKKKKIPKRPLSILLYSESLNKISVTDAKYGARGAEIECLGAITDGIEVNGYHLKALIEKFPDDRMIELNLDDLYLSIRSEGFSTRLPRLDQPSKGKTRRKPLPHKGKVEHPPDPTEKRAEFHETWGFSARIPMPESAVKKK